MNDCPTCAALAKAHREVVAIGRQVQAWMDEQAKHERLAFNRQAPMWPNYEQALANEAALIHAVFGGES